MKKRSLLLFCMVVVSLFLTGCMGGVGLVEDVEEIDQSTRIIWTTEVREEINYTSGQLEYIQDEKMYTSWFSTRLRPALDWMKENSEPDDKVLTWWDNGHLIRGYVQLEPIIYTPSRNLIETVAEGKWDEEKMGEFANPDDVTNVAYALLADSPTITIGIMTRYKTKWAFVPRIDMKKVAGMAVALDERAEDYLDDLGDPKGTVKHKVLFKMADGWTVKGFKLVYQDDYAYVYELPLE
ncbi:hypothetical protein HQ545_01910 [Candidatus Woesearchaeota archaeon]|nr:hypothetical protein [Candidatus Woesearchaeota archaeon]